MSLLNLLCLLHPRLYGILLLDRNLPLSLLHCLELLCAHLLLLLTLLCLTLRLALLLIRLALLSLLCLLLRCLLLRLLRLALLSGLLSILRWTTLILLVRICHARLWTHRLPRVLLLPALWVLLRGLCALVALLRVGLLHRYLMLHLLILRRLLLLLHSDLHLLLQ